MVSAVARPYIDASVPVLREHGLAITRTFYRNMFAAHPELTNLFNMGNQASGVQQQSLAAAVFAYAANIDNAAALAPVVSRIVHKHVSVGIRAEHYPIVGTHLLGAIREVLGDAATEPLINAWAEAYGELADALIAAEKAMYEAARTAPGELRAMRVTSVSHESEDVRAYRLEPLDGKPAPAFQPGQYVSVSVTFEDGHTQLRQYSLSDAPDGKSLRISVKREREEEGKPAGEVSNWIYRHVTIGSVLQITHPFGDFTPDVAAKEPIVLLSAGVGITPMISVLNAIAKTNPQREVVFAHAARGAAWQAHRGDIEAAQALMPNLRVATFYEDGEGVGGNVHAGLMDVAKLPQWPHAQATVYLCGPIGFMQTQWSALLAAGVPQASMHREVFGPELLNYLG
jgi:nitric oxide dioxygenase